MSIKDSVKYTYSDFLECYVPSDAYPYVHLGDARRKIAHTCLSTVFGPASRGARLLDVGTGEGLFSFAVAKAFPHARIVGVDPVDSRVQTANRFRDVLGLAGQISFICGSLADISERFNCISTFLSLCEFSRDVCLAEICEQLRDRLIEDGELLLCEAFPECSSDPRELVGYSFHQAVGYEYRPLSSLISTLNSSGFVIRSIFNIETQAEPLGLQGAGEFILREGNSCLREVAKPSELWDALRPLLIKTNGTIIFDPRITIIKASAI